MKLALKKIKVFEEASDKSVCFFADFWVDDMCVAEVKNLGDGKPHVWKPVKFYQKFKPEQIEAKLNAAKLATDLDHWVNSVIKAKLQQDEMSKSLRADEKVELDDITGDPVIRKKETTEVWKPKKSKMATTPKPDYSKLPLIKLDHKGQTFDVRLIGETVSHGKLYNKYLTKEGKILHQRKAEKPSEPKAKTPEPKKKKIDISDL